MGNQLTLGLLFRQMQAGLGSQNPGNSLVQPLLCNPASFQTFQQEAVILVQTLLQYIWTGSRAASPASFHLMPKL